MICTLMDHQSLIMILMNGKGIFNNWCTGILYILENHNLFSHIEIFNQVRNDADMNCWEDIGFLFKICHSTQLFPEGVKSFWIPFFQSTNMKSGIIPYSKNISAIETEINPHRPTNFQLPEHKYKW